MSHRQKNSRDWPEPLTWTFAFSHTLPLGNFRRISGVQCMFESSFRPIKCIHTEEMLLEVNISPFLVFLVSGHQIAGVSCYLKWECRWTFWRETYFQRSISSCSSWWTRVRSSHRAGSTRRSWRTHRERVGRKIVIYGITTQKGACLYAHFCVCMIKWWFT